ncbi:penicillin acylase family protein [Sphingomonas sp. AOB5]|uniref:penicillin acylase family protein n=1 Tax=Sphingomonas sp. AOB5 TaxID=3034017 RepID=UPI0023F7FA3A|nr:penicillin acylase family protein [Sphingomonas sp. AOB5]MDF7776308.1 penicillin acylase family protein [Sphingomonas sp. AOB5]
MKPRHLLLATLAASCATTPALAQRYKATIVRTEQGVPHITARNMAGLGYGSGYAAAQDNGCVIADTLVSVRGERSKYFGATATTVVGFSDAPNLESDLYRAAIADLPALRAAQAKTSADNRAIMEGFRLGYNRYLRDHPEGFGPECRGKPWLKPISSDDMLLMVNSAMTLISSATMARQIATAAPPNAPKTASNDLSFPDTAQNIGLGSNGWAFGADVTANKRGMVVGNPHFPWAGQNRFRRLHLTIPGKFDVMGGGLVFMPTVGIGFNKSIAWTHTVTTASHFTLHELKLDSADPTSYLIDGKPEKMTSRTVTIEVKDGPPVTRTLYATRYGPVAAMPSVGFGWSATTAYALRDANQGNLRSGDAWLAVARARNVGQVRDAIGKTLGIPWVNTIAADAEGNAMYADVTAVPNISAAKAAECPAPSGKSPLARGQGVALLDGTRAACDWEVDATTPAPGLLPLSAQAVVIRRDYVQNSNDSYWLANPNAPHAELSPMLGPWGVRQNLRTRSGIAELEAARAAGSIGPDKAKALAMANGVYAAQYLPDILKICSTRATLAETCTALAGWDRTANADSKGAWLFFSFWQLAARIPNLFAVPFDKAHPATTPNTINPAAEAAILTALETATQQLRDRGVALDAPWGSIQFVERNGERIPVHGGPGSAGVLNAMGSVPSDKDKPFTLTPYHGTSYVQVVSFGEKGPEAESMLAYSQSTNSDSPYYADGTRAYAQKQWIRLPFTPAEVAAAKQGEAVTISE